MNKAVKKIHGCEEDASGEVFHIECQCGGMTDGCKGCGGDGRLEFRRCPRKLVTWQTLKVLNFYSILENFKKWPRDIDLVEQSATFMIAVNVISGEFNDIMEKAREKVNKE